MFTFHLTFCENAVISLCLHTHSLTFQVKAGNREIVVDFKCPGFDRPDILAWFEMVLDPEPPSIDQAGILVKQKSTDAGDIEDDEKTSRGHYRQRSRMRTKLARKSRWRRQTMSQRHMLFGGVQSPGSPSALGPHFAKSPLRGMAAPYSGHRGVPKIKKVLSSGPSIMQGDSTLIMMEEKSTDDMDGNDSSSPNGRKYTSSQLVKMYEDEDFVPYYRRNTRHGKGPVKISPVVNGIAYIVQVKAVTLSGYKISAFSQAVTPKGPPPIPKICKLLPLESSVKIEFVCNDYATEEYKAEFEVQTNPQTVTMKGIKSSPYEFEQLKNGRGYKFKVRGVNKEGRSTWSEVSKPVRLPQYRVINPVMNPVIRQMNHRVNHHRNPRVLYPLTNRVNVNVNENGNKTKHKKDKNTVPTKHKKSKNKIYSKLLCQKENMMSNASITRRYTKQYTEWYYKQHRRQKPLKNDFMAIECRQRYLVPLDP